MFDLLLLLSSKSNAPESGHPEVYKKNGCHEIEIFNEKNINIVKIIMVNIHFIFLDDTGGVSGAVVLILDQHWD